MPKTASKSRQKKIIMNGTQMGVLFWIVILLGIVFLGILPPILVARAAKNKGRSGCLWFLLAATPGIGPLLAGFFLLILGDSKHKLEKDIIKQEQIKEKYQEQRKAIEAQANAKVVNEEAKHKQQKDSSPNSGKPYKAGLYQFMQDLTSAQEKVDADTGEKPSAANDWLKPPTTDHSRYMPH